MAAKARAPACEHEGISAVAEHEATHAARQTLEAAHDVLHALSA